MRPSLFMTTCNRLEPTLTGLRPYCYCMPDRSMKDFDWHIDAIVPIAAANMDYKVLVDDDMVLHRHFIRDRAAGARLRRSPNSEDLSPSGWTTPANPLEKLLQETLAARTIRCDQAIDATARALGPVDGSVSVPVT